MSIIRVLRLTIVPVFKPVLKLNGDQSPIKPPTLAAVAAVMVEAVVVAA
jgi:hypothetical protein